MEISQVLFYGLIGQAAFTAVTLGIVAFMQYRLSKKYYKLKDLEKGKLAEAEENARKQIEDAQKKALEIVNRSQSLTEETRKQMQQQILQSISNQLKEYQKIMEQVKVQVINSATQNSQKANDESVALIEELKKSAMSNINQLSVNLQQSISQQQSVLQQKMNVEFASISKAVEEYKEKRLQFVEEQITEMVVQTAKEVIGKSLSLQEHENLIMESLEKAKSENVLH